MRMMGKKAQLAQLPRSPSKIAHRARQPRAHCRVARNPPVGTLFAAEAAATATTDGRHRGTSTSRARRIWKGGKGASAQTLAGPRTCCSAPLAERRHRAVGRGFGAAGQWPLAFPVASASSRPAACTPLLASPPSVNLPECELLLTGRLCWQVQADKLPLGEERDGRVHCAAAGGVQAARRQSSLGSRRSRLPCASTCERFASRVPLPFHCNSTVSTFSNKCASSSSSGLLSLNDSAKLRVCAIVADLIHRETITFEADHCHRRRRRVWFRRSHAARL